MARISAKGLYKLIEKEVFEGVDLSMVRNMMPEVRRQFMLQQVDRLLSNDAEEAMWLSDQFWTSDEGRELIDKNHPWWNLRVTNKLTKQEREDMIFIMDVAELCHDLSLGYPFDLNKIFPCESSENEEDWEKDFRLSNRELTEFIQTTPYRFVALYLVKLMLDYSSDSWTATDLPLARYISNELFPYYLGSTTEEAEESIKQGLKILQEAEEHMEKATKKGLTREEMGMVDMLYGYVSDKFGKKYIEMARELLKVRDEILGKYLSMTLCKKSFVKKVKELAKKYKVELYEEEDILEDLACYAEEFYYNHFHSEDEEDDEWTLDDLIEKMNRILANRRQDDDWEDWEDDDDEEDWLDDWEDDDEEEDWLDDWEDDDEEDPSGPKKRR